jgi:beta-galactosidase
MNDIFIAHHGTSTGPEARRLCGACLWAGIDYDRGYHHQPFLGGVLDGFRLPKFAYYFFQSQRPPEVHVPGLDDGPMVFIANFATPLSPTAVTVFSNCEAVRLLHNGREVGVRGPDVGHRVAHPPITFQLDRFSDERSTMCMSPGPIAAATSELKAEGLIGGKVVATHTVRPPGAPVKLMLEADLCGRDLVADGADWLRVIARVCDSRGTTCPFADDLVHFQVEGEGRILGNTAIGANPVRAEAGMAVALLQATLRPGPILIRATSFGLAGGEVRITSAPPIAAEPTPAVSVQLGEGLKRPRQAPSPVLTEP